MNNGPNPHLSRAESLGSLVEQGLTSPYTNLRAVPAADTGSTVRHICLRDHRLSPATDNPARSRPKHMSNGAFPAREFRCIPSSPCTQRAPTSIRLSAAPRGESADGSPWSAPASPCPPARSGSGEQPSSVRSVRPLGRRQSSSFPSPSCPNPRHNPEEEVC